MGNLLGCGGGPKDKPLPPPPGPIGRKESSKNDPLAVILSDKPLNTI